MVKTLWDMRYEKCIFLQEACAIVSLHDHRYDKIDSTATLCFLIKFLQMLSSIFLIQTNYILTKTGTSNSKDIPLLFIHASRDPVLLYYYMQHNRRAVFGSKPMDQTVYLAIRLLSYSEGRLLTELCLYHNVKAAGNDERFGIFKIHVHVNMHYSLKRKLHKCYMYDFDC